jgi:hypothetical protein
VLIRPERLHAERPSKEQEIPESSKRAACSFKPAKDIKDVAASDDGHMFGIGTTLDPK